jgi:hypothetical protein
VQYDAEGRQIRAPSSDNAADNFDSPRTAASSSSDDDDIQILQRDEKKCTNAADNCDTTHHRLKEEGCASPTAECAASKIEGDKRVQPAKIRGNMRHAPEDEQPQERLQARSSTGSCRSSFEEEEDEEEWFNGNSFTCRQCSLTMSGSLWRMQRHLERQHGCRGSQAYNIIRTEQYYTCQICGEQVGGSREGL